MLQQCFRVPIFIPARNPQHAPVEAGVVVAAGIPGFDQALVAEIPAVQRGAAGFPAFDHEFGFGDGRRFDPPGFNGREAGGGELVRHIPPETAPSSATASR